MFWCSSAWIPFLWYYRAFGHWQPRLECSGSLSGSHFSARPLGLMYWKGKKEAKDAIKGCYHSIDLSRGCAWEAFVLFPWVQVIACRTLFYSWPGRCRVLTSARKTNCVCPSATLKMFQLNKSFSESESSSVATLCQMMDQPDVCVALSNIWLFNK